jgi:aminoglycoside phosphotransferase (APT) family kinase protein
VRRWGQQWERSKTRELPAIDELARRLNNAIPNSPPPTIVHGDYRLDNTMIAPDDRGRILAVLDWEMATLGDPLADVGLFLLYWGRDETQTGNVGATISSKAGFLSADEIVERYAKESGRDVSQLDFYVALAAYKLAIILEGIHARFLMGKTVGEGFDHIGALVEVMVQGALDAASRSSVAALRG